MGLRLRFGAIGTIALAAFALIAFAFMALMLLALIPMPSFASIALHSSSSGSSQSGDFSYSLFENPINTFAFAFIAIIFTIITIVRTSESNDIKIISFASAGSFFITSAAFVALGALADFLSSTPSITLSASTGAKFGWIIFALACALIGAALAYVAEGWRAKSGAGRSIYPIIAHNLSLLFILFASIVFVLGSSSTAYYLDTFIDGKPWFAEIVSNPIALFGWLAFSAIAGYLAYWLLSYSQNSAKKHPLSQFALHTPLAIAGAILLIAGAAMACISAYHVSTWAFPNPWEAPSISLFALALAAIYNFMAFTIYSLLCAAKENLGVPKTGYVFPAIVGGAIAIPSMLALIFSIFGALIAIGEPEAGNEAFMPMAFASLSFIYSCAILYFAYSQASKPYSPSSAQAGSILAFLYEDSQESKSLKTKNALKEQDSELAALKSRVLALEKKVSSMKGRRNPKKS